MPSLAGAPRRQAFSAETLPLTPTYTHLSPCSLPDGSLLLPASSTAYYVSKTAAPAPLHASLESDLLTAISATPSGKIALLAHRSASVRLHALPPTEPASAPRTIRPFQSSNVVSLIAVHPSSQFAAFSAADGNVCIYDLSTLSPTHILSAGAPVTSLSFPTTLDTNRLVAGCDDGSIRIFNLQSRSKSPIQVLHSHVSRITALLFANKSDILVSTSLDAVIGFHDFSEKTVPAPVLVATSSPLTSAAVLPDGRVVVSNPGPHLSVWDASRQVLLDDNLRLPFISSRAKSSNVGEEEDDDDLEDATGVTHLIPTADSLLVALSDHTLLFVNTNPSLSLSSKVECGNLEEIYDVQFARSDAGERQVALATNSSVVWVMRPATSQNPRWTCAAALHGHSANVLSLDVVSTPFGQFLASASRDRTARVWMRSSGKWNCVGVAEGHADSVAAVALSTRSEKNFFVVSAAADRTLKLWSLEGVRKAVSNENPHDDSADEEDGKGSCEIVEVNSKEETTVKLSASWTVLAHEKDINAVAVSPDGTLIATGSQDRSIKMWRTDNGKLMTTCNGHRRGIWSVGFSTVDRVIVSGSGDASVKIWNIETGACLRTMQGHMGGVLRTVFVSRGTQVVSTGADGVLKVWGTRSGECEATLDGHEERVWGLDVEDDGDGLVSGGADGKVVVWKDCTKEVAEADAKREEEEAMMGQVVESAVRSRKWGVAAKGALELGLVEKMKGIVMEVVLKSEDPRKELKKVVKEVVDGRESDQESWKIVGKLLRWCRDWNASGGTKSAAVASYLLEAMLGVWSVNELCDGVAEERRALVEGLVAHCRRHLGRVNELRTKVEVLEHTLVCMKGIVDGGDGDREKSISVGKSKPWTTDRPLKRKKRDREDCEY